MFPGSCRPLEASSLFVSSRTRPERQAMAMSGIPGNKRFCTDICLMPKSFLKQGETENLTENCQVGTCSFWNIRLAYEVELSDTMYDSSY